MKDLTPLQMSVLDAFRDHPTFSYEQARVFLKLEHKNTISRAVHALEKKGYVVLRPEHRFVHLTQKANA